MGIQAFVDVKDIPSTVEVVFAKQRLLLETPDGGYEDAWETIGVLHVDGVEQLVFNATDDESTLWIDVNHWGSNRARYLPWLVKHGIPYIEA